MNNAKSRSGTAKVASTVPLSKQFLTDATCEALFRQDFVLNALKTESEKIKRSLNNSTETIELRRLDVLEKQERLNDLKQRMSENRAETMEDLERWRSILIQLGFQSILKQSPDTWKTKRAETNANGKPNDFDGLVYYSPRGVPILVGKPKAHKDEVMRRISQGADLWFQVEDYHGSRVLLRTSLKRGFRGSKECMQMAADLAARYSDWFETEYDVRRGVSKVPVMYCDSRKVAKRGSKVGQMRQKKSLGRLFGNPKNVEDTTKGKELYKY